YYWRSPDGGWAFASEIKQFTTLPGWQAEANIERVHDFLAGGTSLDESSFFRGVRRLPGGHSLILDVASGDLQTRSWYDIETISPAPLPDGPTAAAEHFHALLEDSVRLRLRADVKIGSGLSGGLDSSSIVCCASRLLGAADRQDQQAVVTSCSPHAEYDEQDYAGEVVRATQATWHKIFTDYDGLTEKFSDLVWHHDEPFGSSSGYAQWSIFECARANGITVMLDGQGADEYLAGYPEFFPALFQERMQQRHFRQLLEEIQEFRLQQSLSTSELGRRLLSTFLPAGLRRHLRVIAGRDRCNWLRSEQATLPIFRASVRDSSLALLKSTRLPNLLQLADRNSMAHSVETRVPFLDHRLVEFALALPAEWKIRHGQTKRLLRDAMRNDVPGKVIERKDKMGLPTAEAIWLRNDAPRVEKILAEIGARLPKLIHEAKLQKQFRNDAKGGKLAIGSGYWRLLCLGQWLDRFEVHIQ
ncbi:MAG: asparagine synthase (glutamine-hydrolyzing), partial [Rhodothermales bacterium]